MTMTTTIPINQLIEGNSIDVLKSVRSHSVDMVLTSPPYWSLRAYQTEPMIWHATDSKLDCNHDFISRTYKLHSGRGDAQKSGKYSQQAPIPDRVVSDATCRKCTAWKGELGLEPTLRLFIDHLMQIFDQVKRVLKSTGTCWVVVGDAYSGSGGAGGDYNAGGLREGQPMFRQQIPQDIPRKSLYMVPERFAIAMIDHGGWRLRNKIVWHKPNAMPQSAKDRFSIDWEYLYLFAKCSDGYYFDTQYEPFKTEQKHVGKLTTTKGSHFGGTKKHAGYNSDTYSGKPWNPKVDKGRIKRSVWSIPTRGFKGAHYAPFPEELCKTPILAGSPPDGIVLDPFCGTGTTCLVAKRLGRQYIGIDISADYLQLARTRLNI